MTELTPRRIVLQDNQCNYYDLTPELLAQARVPEERKAEIAAAIAAAAEPEEEGEVSGYNGNMGGGGSYDPYQYGLRNNKVPGAVPLTFDGQRNLRRIASYLTPAAQEAFWWYVEAMYQE